MFSYSTAPSRAKRRTEQQRLWCSDTPAVQGEPCVWLGLISLILGGRLTGCDVGGSQIRARSVLVCTWRLGAASLVRLCP